MQEKALFDKSFHILFDYLPFCIITTLKCDSLKWDNPSLLKYCLSFRGVSCISTPSPSETWSSPKSLISPWASGKHSFIAEARVFTWRVYVSLVILWIYLWPLMFTLWATSTPCNQHSTTTELTKPHPGCCWKFFLWGDFTPGKKKDLQRVVETW